MKWGNTAGVQLILMRHGVAVERDERAGDDFSRPLTPEGREKTRKAAYGLASFCAAPDIIATSPKVRALQTAEIVLEAWRKPPPLETWAELAEDEVQAWLTKLQMTGAKSVLLVGHEPNLSRFASLLLCGDADTLNVTWKKAGAMALEFVPSGRATLEWMLPPRALRSLGE